VGRARRARLLYEGTMSIFDSIRKALGKPARQPEAVTDASADTGDPGPAAEEGRYTVQYGDTLWKIAEKVYGDGSRYMVIFEANRDLLDEPDRIFPGQELVIPPTD
jgi:nucleoid-associated protein YgaU